MTDYPENSFYKERRRTRSSSLEVTTAVFMISIPSLPVTSHSDYSQSNLLSHISRQFPTVPHS